jgi:glycosyltransferase involved in cell wall biosynthesis
MKKPSISIIIPCYNHGAYLGEALQSIALYSGKSVYEVIIVNDGSTDPYTINVLQQLTQEEYLIIHQENKGLATARNTAIEASRGEYILLLDCDNKIRPEYIDLGIEILDKHQEVGVVYGDACYFGEKSGRWDVPEFDLSAMLLNNYIDACAVIRKSAWQDVGGFDANMPVMGCEDWDFWLSAFEKGWKLYHVNEIVFDYRVRTGSMAADTREGQNYNLLLDYLHKKHFTLLQLQYIENYRQLRKLRKELQNLKTQFKPLLKALLNKAFKSMNFSK